MMQACLRELAQNGRASDRPLRILVLSVSAGNGHLRAAQALEAALHEVAPHAMIKNVDVLTHSTKPFRFCYGDVYVDLINKAPMVLHFFYNMLDRFRAKKIRSPRWDHIRIALEKMNMKPFVRLLQSEPWDLAINTHFLSGEIIATLNEQQACAIPQVTVTTDFETHRYWMTQPCAHYFTATEEGARYLQCLGVPGDNVSVTGIPIHPAFAAEKDRARCQARHGLRGDRPVILQLAGGHGVGPIEDIYRALLDVEVPTELVAVTGYNTAAVERLRAVPVPARHRVQILGYTEEIDEWMAAADLLVTKPGGLTTSEALARGLPLAIVNPVPGQEDRNSDFLLENGAAIKINHIPTLAFKVNSLLCEPERLAQLQCNARRLGRPRAAFDVAERSLAIVQAAHI